MKLNLLKKTAYFVAIAITVTALAACGGDKAKDKEQNTEVTTEEESSGGGKINPNVTPMVSKAPEAADADNLKDVFAERFSMGVAVNSWQLADSNTLDFITKHYTSITMENEMKPDYILDQEASASAEDGMPVLKLDAVDNIMKMAEDAGLKMRGHTLIWHSQTPGWLFRVDYDEDGDYVDRETMLARMESYIKKVLTFCNEEHPGLVYAWDVCNETMNDSQYSGHRTDSPWYITIGEDYIEKAFEFARKYADKDTKLFLNDYGITYGEKCKAIYEVATGLYEKGLLDGIGMQSHHDMENFNPDNLEAAIYKYAQLDGLEIQLTELDLHNNDNSSDSMQKQAELYKQLFDVIVKLDAEEMANVTNVTFWGLNDSTTWLTGFRKETSYPLLFDAGNNPKPCYYSVIESVKEYQ
ncbi:MAG: endo-1,4-beta-xylanase [Lachnospiraceae bacterium]|nr:endo-1,4-beta-xylanase [Lachnospiraceae bacterium]